MLDAYRQHCAERAAEGVPPRPLDAQQTQSLVALLRHPPAGEENFLFDLINNQVSPGVDPAAKVKAAFLTEIATGQASCSVITSQQAVTMLSTMLGGYNVATLVELLGHATLADHAVAALSNTLLVYDTFKDVVKKAQNNSHAKQVLQNWADATWFTSKPTLATEITVTVFKVDGETNTDDLSPASEAWSRPDIPVHAKSMLINRKPGSLAELATLQQKGHPIAYVGDVVGTGSSRKSAVNSLQWHIGRDFPHVPAK
ncbi:MAG: aconitate hydratase B, partial [Magnetococcales bacterium]|nr:aconitate hydratase B [Magnetococcales bacterium]